MFAEGSSTAAKSVGFFLENGWVIPVIPAIAFVIIIGFGKRMRYQGAEVGIASMAASLVMAAGAAYQWIQRVGDAAGYSEDGFARSTAWARNLPAALSGGEEATYVAPVIRSWTWWRSGGFEFTIGQHLDGLAILILLLVAFISLLVQIFSLDYVRGDRRFTHFFAALTLFSAGMLVMVLADNMVQLILGWEIMGLCSFMLIGHWWEEQANSRAALKAFFTVRVGDMGLLVGTAILFFGANAWARDTLGESGFSIQAINAWALSGDGKQSILTGAAVALFIACIGKSGQFPLHTWLPDAMAGPTPVSSLLHSSTMVVAGVYLVARIYPVFWNGLEIPEVNVNLIVVIGAITAIIASLLAFVQNDIKKVLAYSTVSQLGLMMMGLGAGAWIASVFHIFTHAFFKCCLFLCAGSISHSASHHSFDMKKDMGGLRKIMPVTFVCWMIATAALTGFPFLAGFWSKDEIIATIGKNGYDVFFYVGFVSAFLTAAYMTRATYLAFFGEPRGAAAGHHDAHDDHAHADAHAADHDHAADHGHDAHTPAMAHAAHGHDAHAAHGHDAHAAHGHDDHHAAPHESGRLLLGPIVILATLSIFAGFLQAPAFGESFEKLKKWVEPAAVAIALDETGVEHGAGESLLPRARAEEGAEKLCGFKPPKEGEICVFPQVKHAPFSWKKAGVATVIVFAGYAISFFMCSLVYGRRRNKLQGLTERNRLLGAGHRFLVNKYYLDHLYEKVIVHGVAHPISKAAYWVNQKVLDGTVNAVGITGRKTGQWVYRNIDQRVVDGAVNGSGAAARGTGGALRPVQSGKVSQYGALLFSAAAIGALILVIVNS
jgi:NADH-quinone oxidoreductase subunit L